MDFTLDEQQQAVYDLTARILDDKLDMERLRAVEAADEWFDRDIHAELAKAGLVGVALAEDVGGGGQDLVAWGQVLRAQGNHVAPVPLLPTTLAAITIDKHGDAEQRRELLPGVVEGTR
ncbi:MAG: acyl-CoA dehydrogenase family protein, partial [Acidimicrobiia bacterium]|nr:acyl-CoA dehydrogenase family protein [Acidimicrobiia bacterium]